MSEGLKELLLTELRKHDKGLEAAELRGVLESQGYTREQIRATLRNSLDSGLLHLGPGLRLRETAEAA